MKRDPGRAEPKSRRPSPESSRRPSVTPPPPPPPLGNDHGPAVAVQGALIGSRARGGCGNQTFPPHTLQPPPSGWVIHGLKAGTAGGRTKFRPIWSVFRTSHRRSSCSPSCTYVVHGGLRPLERGAKPPHTSRIPSGMLEVCGGWLQSTICSDAEASAK